VSERAVKDDGKSPKLLRRIGAVYLLPITNVLDANTDVIDEGPPRLDTTTVVVVPGATAVGFLGEITSC
jgi:hypothetical protein